MVRFGVCCVVLAGLAGIAQADSLRDAASNAVECRRLSDVTARLACFDATAGPLEAALGAPPVDTEPESQPEVPNHVASLPAAPVLAPAPEPSPSEPTWAAAPAPRRAAETSEPEREAREFTVNIVRITRNNLGRHFFYTEDGAVWEQTQIEEVEPPRSLPALAEFRRRLAGNPTISFDTSSKAYRVRRIE